MKFYVFLSIFFCVFLVSCSNERKKDFFLGSSDCEVAKTQCIKKNYNHSDKTRTQILKECENVRAMCEAVKTKGCLQQCGMNFNKETKEYERCQERCRSRN